MAQNQTQTQDRLIITKYGKGMNSDKPERRYLYLYIDPPPPPESIDEYLKDVASKLKTFAMLWDPPVLSEHLATGPWWLHHTCEYCKRRHHYERQAWIEGRWAWPRRLCMRHYLAWHLYTVSHAGVFNTNRFVSISISQNIAIRMNTVNYKYDININRQAAHMTVQYKNSVYKFTYRNHENAYPHMSSYDLILSSATSLFDAFARALETEWRPYNLVINDAITLPPEYAANQSS
jgi:hypothetical protein